MKKIITMILVLGMIISATACGNSNVSTGSSGSSSESKKDTTSISEKKEETKKDEEDEDNRYVRYKCGFEVKVPRAFREDSIISETILRIDDNSVPSAEQEYILISSLSEESIEPSRLKEIPQILEKQVQEMMTSYMPSRFLETYSQKYDSTEECEYNGYKMLKAKGSITGTNFDGDEEKTVNYVAYYFLITADTGFKKYENVPSFIISYTEKTDKDSLKNIEEYADTAAESIRIYK
jgi:uncharacterized lipoprotein YehR (DUF1307 family)